MSRVRSILIVIILRLSFHNRIILSVHQMEAVVQEEPHIEQVTKFTGEHPAGKVFRVTFLHTSFPVLGRSSGTGADDAGTARRASE
jgi:hypothetical protein